MKKESPDTVNTKEAGATKVNYGCDVTCRECGSFIQRILKTCREDSRVRQCICMLFAFCMINLYYNISMYFLEEADLRFENFETDYKSKIVLYPQKSRLYRTYKYQLTNSSEIVMTLQDLEARAKINGMAVNNLRYADDTMLVTASERDLQPILNKVNESNYRDHNGSSYRWFVSVDHLFKNLGEDERPTYKRDTPTCKIKMSTLGKFSPVAVDVDKAELDLKWVEKQHPDVKSGGFYAPLHCRSSTRVAVLVPYRKRQHNLTIFLLHLHRLLKKQLLEYRIFVIEQFGTDKWNKGMLYNLAYLEIQRFGTWDCLIFHDVDLIPENEKILYRCHKYPTHMSAAVEKYQYTIPYENLFGGVISLTPTMFESVNGFSNFYWNWGAEDDDMFARLNFENYTIYRYNISIGRYASLPHATSQKGDERKLFRVLSKTRYKLEGLSSTKYKLISVVKRKLFTHILADVNPDKIKLDSKNLINDIVRLNGNEISSRELKVRKAGNEKTYKGS